MTPTTKFRFPEAALVGLAATVGLVLSVMSALDICTSACTEATSYLIFGQNMGWFGAVFFGALLAAATLRRRYSRLGEFIFIMIWAAAGAELRFIWVQKYEMGKWCPLCLSIAATVYTMALLISLNSVYRIRRAGDKRMKPLLKKVAIAIVAMSIGVAGAVIGVKKEAGAAELDLFLGNASSSIAVYFVSDWFCPACRRVEPAITKMFNKVAEVAKISFIDIPVHPETSNFTPFNTEFLIYEKTKYIQLRKALNELAKKTKTPSHEEVQKAIAPLGVKLRFMNYADIAAGMNWNREIFSSYDVRATPTVIVVNEKNGRHLSLVGENEISYEAIVKAVASLKR